MDNSQEKTLNSKGLKMFKKYNSFDTFNDFLFTSHIEYVLAKRRLDNNPEYNIEVADFVSSHWDNLRSCFKRGVKYEYKKTN